MAWYNMDWHARKIITNTGGTSGSQTDYQMKYTVPWDSDMQADFDDLRFTKADGITLIDAWLESKVNSTSAIVWVETDTPADGVGGDIYMYYANANASSNWSGANTFLQYHGATTTDYMDSAVVNSPFVYESRLKVSSSEAECFFGLTDDSVYNAGDGVLIATFFGWRNLNTYNDSTSSWTGAHIPVSAGTYHRFKIINTGSAVTGFVDGDDIGGALTTNLPDEPIGLWVNSLGTTFEQEWSFARKYVANPATYVIGSEEKSFVPTIIMM